MEQAKKASALKAAVAAALAAVAIAVCAALPQSAWAMEVSDKSQLAAAIESGEITLANNLTADVVIPVGKEVTINLNGFTLTNESGHTIDNSGTLVVNGSGNIVNVSSGKGALNNAKTGNATLNGGTLKGDSWYVIENQGRLTMCGADLVQNHSGSSAIDNGDDYQGQEAYLTITAGNFKGGMNVVKNDAWGVLDISGGSFTSDAGPAVLNWNQATISGGSFSTTSPTSSVVANGYANDTLGQGNLTITGGTFTAANNGTGSLFGTNGDSTAGGAFVISDGVFNGVVTAPASSDPIVSGGTFSDESVAGFLGTGDAVIFTGNGFKVDTEKNVKAQAVASVTKDGKTIYYTTKEAAQQAAAQGGVTADPVTVTVTFELGTGVAANVVTVDKGDTVAKPADPTYEGWKFVGWFSDADFKNAYDFATPVTGDITIYAGWNEVPASSTDEPAATADVKKSSSAKTGDTNLFVPVAAVAGIAAAVALGAVAYRRKMQ